MSEPSKQGNPKKFRDRARLAVTKVVDKFRPNSRQPSRAPSPDPGPAATSPASGNTTDQGAVLPWVEWEVDQSSLAELKQWNDAHENNKLSDILQKIDGVLQSKPAEALLGLIPDSPLPVKTLVRALISVLQLGMKIPGARQNAYDFAQRVAKDITSLVKTFGTTSGPSLRESWDDLAEMRDIVNDICKWANEQLHKSFPEVSGGDLRSWKEKLAEAKSNFMQITIVRIRAAEALKEQMNSIKEKFCNRIALRVRYEEQNKAFCYQGTRVGILKGLEWWATEPSDAEHFCWITGIPGSGKSTISATVARRLKDCEVLCAQYFISRNIPDTTDPNKLFPTIAQQLAEKSPSAAQAIHKALKTSSPDTLGAEQAKSLLLDPIRAMAEHHNMIVVVIDALDELQRTDQIPSILASIASQLPNNAKLIITSRPDDEIITAINNRFQVNRVQLEIGDSRNEVDQFIRAKLREMTPKKKGWEGWPTNGQLQRLSQRADGLFHYAATALNWIEGRIKNAGRACKDSVFNQVDDLGVGDLHGLYKLVLTAWEDVDAQTNDPDFRKSQLQGFQHVIGCLIVLKVPLSVASIRALLANAEFDIDNFFERMRSILIPGTTSLTDETIPQMHKSFRDYITSEQPPELFRIKTQDAHMVTAMACLKIVVNAERSHVNFHYACLQWHHHLRSGIEEQSDWKNDMTVLLEKMLLDKVHSMLDEYAGVTLMTRINTFRNICVIGWYLMEKQPVINCASIELNNVSNLLVQMKKRFRREEQLQRRPRFRLQQRPDPRDELQDLLDEPDPREFFRPREFNNVPYLNIWDHGLIEGYKSHKAHQHTEVPFTEDCQGNEASQVMYLSDYSVQSTHSGISKSSE